MVRSKLHTLCEAKPKPNAWAHSRRDASTSASAIQVTVRSNSLSPKPHMSFRIAYASIPQIIDSGASVHVIELTAVNAGPPSEPDLMTLVSDQTRGQSTTIYSSASYGAALDRLADRLAIEMMVEYIVPPGPRAGDVRVGVRVPGARVVGLGIK